MAKNSGSKRVKDKMMLVSFKLSGELYDKLSRYAKSQTDDSGKELSTGQAARRLMLESLRKQEK